MFKKLLVVLLTTHALGLSAPPAAFSAESGGTLATIPALDVPRYMGRWYEIAKYPNRFQKKCVGDTTAEYSLQPGGTLQVINRCRTEGGRFEEAIGAARQIGEPSSAKLEVRFAPSWLSFVPAVWGDYWVIALDADYQLAAVSEPQREYLWILSRSPMVRPGVYERLLQRLRQQGFETGRLEMSPHTAAN